MKPSGTIKAVLFIGVLCLSGFVDTNNVALARDSKTFRNPTIKGYRLDWCLYWAKQCGKPAADAWCDRKAGKGGGFAEKFEKAVNIGASHPTYVIAERKVCNQQYCDGFQWIRCGFGREG